ncbi:PREDICTED: uncharacterized protein LOC109582567 [Amphimedon queenslandica]|uniref:Uncharacterized protein n=1 Tax=Amphimedon queenslandica TaxID=400682 RepID=A0A1X7URT0_AMPQE|nr:PREDICTED: uncharacterized protein LOC109582567 [Amphimedon queenslandica]|eukprot:XP_019852871.1 PREDICTED: uncharacterized protein LOC109582567 [Amphimedon queenslandica]
MSSITFIQSSSLLMLFILFGFSSASNQHSESLLKGSQVLSNSLVENMTRRGVPDEAYRKVISDLCTFYQSIDEYREVTANDTSNVTKAMHIVLNATYNDSCKWLQETINDYDCTDISSIDVTEICTFLEAFNATKGLLDVFEDNSKTPTGGSFTIECDDGNCDSVCVLLGNEANCDCKDASRSKPDVITCQ